MNNFVEIPTVKKEELKKQEKIKIKFELEKKYFDKLKRFGEGVFNKPLFYLLKS